VIFISSGWVTNNSSASMASPADTPTAVAIASSGASQPDISPAEAAQAQRYPDECKQVRGLADWKVPLEDEDARNYGELGYSEAARSASLNPGVTRGHAEATTDQTWCSVLP
jgi:hypothetical protein